LEKLQDYKINFHNNMISCFGKAKNDEQESKQILGCKPGLAF
jgi:hypothetical protein